jgi:hypothetical protein
MSEEDKKFDPRTIHSWAELKGLSDEERGQVFQLIGEGVQETMDKIKAKIAESLEGYEIEDE